MIKKHLKIILFDGSFTTTTFINRLAEGLVLNHEVFIIGFNEHLKQPVPNVKYIPIGSNQNKLSFIKTTLYWSLKAKSITHFFFIIKNLFNNKKTALQQANLHTALDAINPDIIHLQWPSLLPWFEMVLDQQKYPVVLSQRGFHINVRPFVNEDNITYLQKWFPKISAFHSVSKAISKVGDLIYNNPKKIDRVVYTGFNLQQLPYQQPLKEDKILKIISVGRSHWIKGYAYAIRAFALLKEKEVSFTYTILGSSPDEEMLYLINHFQLENNIVFTPKVPQEKVYTLLQQQHLFLLPSIEEGLPNVLVEAMALGIPVIASNCGGVPELVEEGMGQLVPTRDPEAIAQAIIKFCNKSEKDIQLQTQKARKKVEVQHQTDQMVAGMEALYFEVLKGKM